MSSSNPLQPDSGWSEWCLQAPCKPIASRYIFIASTKSCMSRMQVFPRFRGSECPGKYPLYNIRKEKFEKQRFSLGFHARPDLEFYRGPRAGGGSLLPIRVVLAVPPVARDWENRISTINPLQPVIHHLQPKQVNDQPDF